MSGEYQSLGTGADAMEPGSWYENAYYQILLVKPKGNATPTPEDSIHTTIVAKQRKDPGATKNGGSSSDRQYFTDYQLDERTKNRLSSYPKPPDYDQNPDSIATYLPSPGIVFPTGFVQALSKQSVNDSFYNNSIELGNFYKPIRVLLYTRKISQLIARTWDAYLRAKSTTTGRNLWKFFIHGDWDQFEPNETDILDGLIAREIFLTEQDSSSDSLEPNDLDIYYPLKSHYDNKKTRFLILPNSKAWSGITLSLLLAGQAYYPVDQDGKYTKDIGSSATKFHQISEPMLSTGEIVEQYGLEVSWDKFKGEMRELGVNAGSNSIAYQVTIPYPPIPSQDNLDPLDIRAWANAKDDPTPEEVQNGAERQFPFYSKHNGSYLVDVQYFSPPFPYIPLSCT